MNDDSGQKTTRVRSWMDSQPAVLYPLVEEDVISLMAAAIYAINPDEYVVDNGKISAVDEAIEIRRLVKETLS